MQQAIISQNNKLLAFTQRRIPYIPELKERCGSVTASIVMQQLEYWFEKKSYTKIYKLLEPCSHPKYVAGDSWTEELSFSVNEFRTAFDKIGVRYRSKSKLQEVIDNGSNPFGEGESEKYYLSYIDVRSGLTYYIRNHNKVNSLLDELIYSYSSEKSTVPAVGSRDVESAVLEICSENFQNCASHSSIYNETEEDKQKNTAAEKKLSLVESNHSPSCEQQQQEPEPKKSTTKKPAAAAYFPKKINPIIGTSLDKNQASAVSNMLESVSEDWSNEKKIQLQAEVIHVMENTNCFTKCGNDFLRKLNTIKKQIKEGVWVPPATLINQEKKEKSSAENQLKERKRALESDCRHWQRVLDMTHDERLKKDYTQYLHIAQENLRKFAATLC